MRKLSFTTLQAPNQEFVIEELCAYVGERLGIETEFVIDVPWQERERLFDSGQIDIAWICGLPYIWKAARDDIDLELLVAPVMQGERYQDRPVYYSDVIVRRESEYHHFEDLRGARWAYNEPGSQSGYNITRYHLARMEETGDFFGDVVAAGSHHKSIEMVLDGVIDAAAIDTTVLALEEDLDGRIRAELRVIDSLGPSPIPPLVILKQVEPGLREQVRELLAGMHNEERGRRVLNEGKIKRLAVVSDKDYDLIREMAAEAQGVEL